MFYNPTPYEGTVHLGLHRVCPRAEGVVMSDRWSDRPLDWIKPRNLGPNPHCPSCKSESPITGAYGPGAMFHPAHPYGPCQVRTDAEVCGCRLSQLRAS